MKKSFDELKDKGRQALNVIDRSWPNPCSELRSRFVTQYANIWLVQFELDQANETVKRQVLKIEQLAAEVQDSYDQVANERRINRALQEELQDTAEQLAAERSVNDAFEEEYGLLIKENKELEQAAWNASQKTRTLSKVIVDFDPELKKLEPLHERYQEMANKFMWRQCEEEL